MLTTRCPDCRTTFRITSPALHKAAGQVRCGRCGAVFDAFASLTDARRPAQTLHDPPREPVHRSQTAPDSPPEPRRESPAEPQQAAPPEPQQEPPAGTAPAAAEEIEEILERAPSAPPETWHPVEPVRAAPRGWRLAAALAGIVLVLQGVHHFRGRLATIPYFGPHLERVYAQAGLPIPADTDPANFTIVDWVAAAQESENSQPGRLEISTGIRNDSNQPMAYPLLSLELTDRWEKVIGARVFTPAEYVGAQRVPEAGIPAGATVTAELELVDPGPDAYGFEVDVCVPIDAARMRCKSDAVFE
jgi:predicted Zn finger-like uncharacterized protein